MTEPYKAFLVGLRENVGRDSCRTLGTKYVQHLSQQEGFVSHSDNDGDDLNGSLEERWYFHPTYHPAVR